VEGLAGVLKGLDLGVSFWMLIGLGLELIQDTTGIRFGNILIA